MTHNTPLQEAPKYHPCNVCGVDAIACLSPDMDIKGLCYCKTHKIDVMMVYSLLMNGNEEDALKLMKKWKHQ